MIDEVAEKIRAACFLRLCTGILIYIILGSV